MKKFPIGPTDQLEFEERIKESFPSLYLTLISIIQGVSFGILILKTSESLNIQNYHTVIPLSILSFIFIVIVTYEYSWFVGIFRWSPSILDTFIPFALGLFEIFPMFFLTKPSQWCLWSAIFCFLGALAFFNSFWHCKNSPFGYNKNAQNRTIKAFELDIKMSLTMCIIAAISSIFSLFWIFIVAFISSAIFMIYKNEIFMEELHKDYELFRS
jgi:hypothetical protein